MGHSGSHFRKKNYTLVIKLTSCCNGEPIWIFFIAFCSFFLVMSCCTIAAFKRQHICKNDIYSSSHLPNVVFVDTTFIL